MTEPAPQQAAIVVADTVAPEHARRLLAGFAEWACLSGLEVRVEAEDGQIVGSAW